MGDIERLLSFLAILILINQLKREGVKHENLNRDYLSIGYGCAVPGSRNGCFSGKRANTLFKREGVKDEN